MGARLAALDPIALGPAGAPGAAPARTPPAPSPRRSWAAGGARGAPRAHPRPARTRPRPADPFGEDVTLASKTIVFSKGSANWDSAFDTLVEAFKKIQDALDKQGVKGTGPAMTIYTATDDNGFEFQAGI